MLRGAVMKIAERNAKLEPESIAARLVLNQHIVIPLHDQGAVLAPAKRHLGAQIENSAFIADVRGPIRIGG